MSVQPRVHATYNAVRKNYGWRAKESKLPPVLFERILLILGTLRMSRLTVKRLKRILLIWGALGMLKLPVKRIKRILLILGVLRMLK